MSSVHRAAIRERDSDYSVLCRSTFPLSADTTCTAAICSMGIDVLPDGCAVTPVNATQLASCVSLPSRPTTTIATLSPASSSSLPSAVSGHTPYVQVIAICVPHAWGSSATVALIDVGVTRVIGIAAALACAGGTGVGIGEFDCTATNMPIT